MNFYRYEDVHTSTGASISLRVFFLLRETPKGYWIIPEYYASPNYNGTSKSIEAAKRWVPKNSVRRYAYPEKKKAFHNFVKRKQFQIYMNEMWLSRATIALAEARFHEECPDFLKDKT